MLAVTFIYTKSRESASTNISSIYFSLHPGTKMAPAPVRSHLEGVINALEYPRDFPIIVHTLVNGLVHIDLYPINNLDGAELPYSESHSLRWLHVPANNMQWVENCMKAWYPNFAGLDNKSWALKLRPALSDIITPLHARHMEPSCTAIEADPIQSRNTRIPGTMDMADHGLNPPSPGMPSESNRHVDSNQGGDESDQADESNQENDHDQKLVPSESHQPEVNNTDIPQQPVIALYVSGPPSYND
jgi:hypothetical protein